jgi:hypothetical protein
MSSPSVPPSSEMKFIGVYTKPTAIPEKEPPKPKGMGAFFNKALTHFVLQFRAKVMGDSLSQNLLELYDLEHKLADMGQNNKPMDHKVISLYRASVLKLVSSLEKDTTLQKETPVLLDGVEWLATGAGQDWSNLDRTFAPQAGKANSTLTEEQAKRFREAFGPHFDEIATQFYQIRKAIAQSEFSCPEALKVVTKKDSKVKDAEETFSKEFKQIKERNKDIVGPLLKIHEEFMKNAGKKIY